MSWTGGPGDVADARMAARIIFEDPVKQEPRKPVADHPRHPQPDDPPEPGAQWNELSGRWERWDEATQGWEPVGEPGAAG